MPLRHSHTAAGTNDATKEVSVNRWNADHVITDGLDFPAWAAPTVPPADNVRIFGRKIAGRMLPAIIGPAGIDTTLQPNLSGNKVLLITPTTGTTAPDVVGGTLTTAATMSFQWAASNTNPWDARERKRFQTSTTAGNASGMRTAYRAWYRSSTAGYGGFFFRAMYGQSINLNGAQAFIGLCNLSTALAGDPSALLNMCGVGYDAADPSTGNWQFMRNDGSGTAVKVDLGTNAARGTSQGWELTMFIAPGAAELFVRVVNLNTGAVALDTSYTTELPAVNTGLCFKGECRNGAVAAATNLEFSSVYIEKDY